MVVVSSSMGVKPSVRPATSAAKGATRAPLRPAADAAGVGPLNETLGITAK